MNRVILEFKENLQVTESENDVGDKNMFENGTTWYGWWIVPIINFSE